jgi:hypothetical protein
MFGNDLASVHAQTRNSETSSPHPTSSSIRKAPCRPIHCFDGSHSVKNKSSWHTCVVNTPRDAAFNILSCIILAPRIVALLESSSCTANHAGRTRPCCTYCHTSLALPSPDPRLNSFRSSLPSTGLLGNLKWACPTWGA